TEDQHTTIARALPIRQPTQPSYPQIQTASGPCSPNHPRLFQSQKSEGRLMGLWQLAVPFALCCLSGCASAEIGIGALVPDQLRAWPELGLAPVQDDRTLEPSAVPKPKIARQQKPQPSPGSVPEPNWPPWTTPAPKPQRVLQSSLAPSELFKNLSPSVYTVAVLGQAPQQVASQGSAVAVSSREAITSCHVVSRGRTIVLINGAATL